MIKPTVLLFMALLLSGAVMANEWDQFEEVLDERYPKDVLYCTETAAGGLVFKDGEWESGRFETGRFTLKFSRNNPTEARTSRGGDKEIYTCEHQDGSANVNEGAINFNEGAICTSMYFAGQLIIDLERLTGVVAHLSAAGVRIKGSHRATHHAAAFTCEAF